MIEIQKPYSIDLELYDKNPLVSPVHYISGDCEVYPLDINLFARHRSFAIPEGSILQLNFTNSNGVKYPAFAEIIDREQGLIQYNFTQSDLSVSGITTASITVISGSERLTWQEFNINVIGNPSNGQTDPPDPWESWADSIVSKLSSLESGGGGDTGTAATINVGSVTTVDPDTSASVVNSGTSKVAIFDFSIPRGYTGETGAKGEDGVDGLNGESAYALAVSRGFTGSEEDWLESLKGKDGIKCNDGTNATIEIGTVSTVEPDENAEIINSGSSNDAIFDFKIPRGLKGESGVDGRSAYEISVTNGFVGTESEWLASLQGGAGQQGNSGTNGQDGKSAYALAVDNGYVGSESGWLASLKGNTGDTGSDGLSAYEVALYNSFIGTEAEWLASLKGDTGGVGPKGDAGINGADGYTPVKGVDYYTSEDKDGIVQAVLAAIQVDASLQGVLEGES